jgi:hypothetical protein
MTDHGVTVTNSLGQARHSVSLTLGYVGSASLALSLRELAATLLPKKAIPRQRSGGVQVKLHEYACLLGTGNVRS